MGGHSLRRRLLLSSTMLAAALGCYGRSAYGQVVCLPGVGAQFICSGASVDTQTINLDNAAVFTSSYGFSVDTTAGGGSGGNAVTITGDGFIAYTDGNASPLTAAATALYIQSTGNAGGVGGLSVFTNGALTGSDRGIDARNYGSLGLTITANGNVTGNDGIFAQNGTNLVAAGTDLTITTGAGTTVTGGTYGIVARNYGSGALEVTAKGNVEGMAFTGIRAHNDGTNLTVTTAADIYGGFNGIYATNNGNGTLNITANGDVTGDTGVGILPTTSAMGSP